MNDSLWRYGPSWYEIHRDRIDAMADVPLGELLPFKNMAEVTFAVRADNFHATTVRIQISLNPLWYLVVETGPAASTVKFAFRLIERGVALAAYVETLCFKLGVLTYARGLSPFVDDYSNLLWG